MYDPDDYPEGHSPFCHRSCDHSCHDAYDADAAVARRDWERSIYAQADAEDAATRTRGSDA